MKMQIRMPHQSMSNKAIILKMTHLNYLTQQEEAGIFPFELHACSNLTFFPSQRAGDRARTRTLSNQHVIVSPFITISKQASVYLQRTSRNTRETI